MGSLFYVSRPGIRLFFRTACDICFSRPGIRLFFRMRAMLLTDR